MGAVHSEPVKRKVKTMSPGHLLLQQNSFPSNYVGSFQQLRDSGELLDVTLACEDKTIEAHKVILSACSPFFRNLFSKIEQNHPYIYLKGILHKDLLALIDYIYNGETKIGTDDLNRFIDAAEELKIKGLAEEGIRGHTVNRHGVDTSKEKEIYYTGSVQTLDISDNAERFGEAGLSMWKCKECGKLYKDENTMRKHIETHHLKIIKLPIKEETVFIDESTVAEYSTEIDQHQNWRLEISKRLKEINDPKKGKLWKCTECGKIRKSKFKQECHVETHVKQLGIISFTCEHCDKICKTTASLKSHINIKHEDEKVNTIS